MKSVHTAPKPTFFIDNIPIYGDLVMAPLDGYSDLPFRIITRKQGSSISYTEFINAIEVINGHPYLEKRTTYKHFERPLVFQIFDNDPERILKAALILRKKNPDIIDINMGCSVKGVSNRGAGAGLLQEPQKIDAIFKKLCKELDIPITGKIRLGWNAENLNYLEISKIIEGNGGKAIAVHGRTRKQAFTGRANWDAIAEVKAIVNIPVIGNGDVVCKKDIEKMKKHTQCDAVMIGRAAISNPWIFSRRDRHEISKQEVTETIVEHLSLMLDFYGVEYGLRRFRKFANNYIQPYQYTREQRKLLLTCKSPIQFLDYLKEII